MGPDAYNSFETAKRILSWVPVALVAIATSFTVAHFHKPAPTIVQPVTVVKSSGASVGADGAVVGMTRSEQRQAAAQWGELDQKEINALAAKLKDLPKVPLTIFCADNALCGDMQLDFDNAFETAHWDTRLEKPLIDDTVGIATSSPLLCDAISAATAGRLNVAVVPKNGPRDFVVIGRKK